MNIWNLNMTSATALLLWRTSEGKFRVVQQGHRLALLTNPDYVLIDKKYEAILHKLTGQVTFTPVTIIDKVRKLTFDKLVSFPKVRPFES